MDLVPYNHNQSNSGRVKYMIQIDEWAFIA